MGKSKDLATGETRFVNTAGDTMTGHLGVGGDPVPSASNYNNAVIHARQAGSSSVGSQLRLTTGATGHAAGDGSFISQWADSGLYITNQESAHIAFSTGGSERARIDASGRVTTPYQPGWHGTHSDAYSSSYSAGQAHNMQSSLEKYNVGNHFDYTNNRFTCPITGYYLLYGWDICIDSSSVYNVGNAIGCWKNTYSGANRLVSIYRQYNRGYSFTGTAYLAANDYVTFGNSESSIGAGAYYGSHSYSGYGIRLIA
tara:strand:- start:68 stop:835 length:768 start_codon:yes stop_codon:yes gene_type:complete